MQTILDQFDKASDYVEYDPSVCSALENIDAQLLREFIAHIDCIVHQQSIPISKIHVSASGDNEEWQQIVVAVYIDGTQEDVISLWELLDSHVEDWTNRQLDTAKDVVLEHFDIAVRRSPGTL